MASSEPGECSEYVDRSSEVSVELNDTDMVTKLAENALGKLKAVPPEPAGSDEKLEKSEATASPVENVSIASNVTMSADPIPNNPVQPKNAIEEATASPVENVSIASNVTKSADPIPNTPVQTKTAIEESPLRLSEVVTPSSSSVAVSKPAETVPSPAVTPKATTLSSGNISTYSEPPDEVDVELDQANTSISVPPKCASELSVPVTAVSASNVPVTAVSASNVPVSAVSASNVPVTAVSASNVPVTAVSASSVPVSAVSASNDTTAISYGRSDPNVLTAVTPSTDMNTAKGMCLVTSTEIHKTDGGPSVNSTIEAVSVLTNRTDLVAVNTKEPIYMDITKNDDPSSIRVNATAATPIKEQLSAVNTKKDSTSLCTSSSVASASQLSCNSSQLSCNSMPPTELDCEIPDETAEDEDEEDDDDEDEASEGKKN